MSFNALSVPDVRDVPVFVYALCDPDGRVRYVGRSERPRKRLAEHRCSRALAMREWLTSLRSRGLAPQLRILEKVEPGVDAAAREAALIATFAPTDLLNAQGTTLWQKARGARVAANAGGEALLRTGHNFTFIGSACGVTHTMIWKLVSGRCPPSETLRASFEAIFGVAKYLWDEPAAVTA